MVCPGDVRRELQHHNTAAKEWLRGGGIGGGVGVRKAARQRNPGGTRTRPPARGRRTKTGVTGIKRAVSTDVF